MLSGLLAGSPVRLAAASAVGAVFMMALAFGSGWKIQGWRYEARLNALQSLHAQALADAQAVARAIEQQRQTDMERVSHETEEKLAAVVVAERRAADERVRDVAARYAARARSTPEHTDAARQCEADTTAARMLADLLGELDELAQVYARAADRARVAGLACEAGFEALRVQEK